jgi:hypothetical protein
VLSEIECRETTEYAITDSRFALHLEESTQLGGARSHKGNSETVLTLADALSEC